LKLVRHIRDLPHVDLKVGSVVTIGNFDGFHCGHRKLLDRVILKSHSLKMPSIVMSFEPTPKEFFSSANPPARLMRFREKFDFLANQGIDIFYCPQFSPAMQSIRSIDFIRQVLVQGMNVRHIIVGDDFHFARKREGSIEDFLQTKKLLGFTVEKIDSIFNEGVRISSTVIRSALASGNLNLYRMSGRVVKGRQIGRKLGYPTANVNLRRRQSAIQGIFAVKVSGLKDGIIFGVASVGTRPTFGLIKPILEIHLLDFNRDIYGEYIHVDFIARIRDELKFESEGDLVKAMNQDVENARSIFSIEQGK
jgi:riboflavin kinase/FMN adenylyltransferase